MMTGQYFESVVGDNRYRFNRAKARAKRLTRGTEDWDINIELMHRSLHGYVHAIAKLEQHYRWVREY